MNELVNQIANGTAVLLSADDICSRLAVSRSTFDRWVRNGTSPLDVLKERAKRRTTLGMISHEDMMADRADREDGRISFPPPDIRIGGSPRWSISTFKAWLSKNLTAAS